MTDRELLEAAAKAAGMDVHWGSNWQSDMMFRAIPRPNSPLVANVQWDPLADDGDALRLAVTLGLTINPYKRGIFVSRDEGEPVILEEWGEDDYAATRRAIVRAAAEIGRGMK